MSSTHIEISTNTERHSRDLRSLVDGMSQTLATSRRLKRTYDQVAMDSDWVSLQSLLGLDSTAEAQAVYNLLGGIITELEADSNYQQMLGRLG
jgi:hypothetical protein